MNTEAAPEESPQELVEGQEHPVGDATQTPVNYEDTIKGPAGDTDPATQKWREENWTDADTARARAEVEDQGMTAAADARRTAQVIEGLDKNNEPVDSANIGGVIESAREIVDEKLPDLKKRESRTARKEAQHSVKSALEYYADQDLALRRDAERAETEALKLGDWAEILHKNPLSEEYKHYAFKKLREVNPELVMPDFDAVDMRRLERAVETERRSVDSIEEVCKELEEKGFLGVRNPYGNEYDAMSMANHFAQEGSQDIDWKEKWPSVKTNPEATLREVGATYAEMLRSGILEYKSRMLQEQMAILEAIRSGNAEVPAAEGSSA